MECSQVRKIIYENAEAEADIPAEVREAFEEHLAGCGPCAAHFKTLKDQSEALRSLPRILAPADFLENVRRRVEKPSPGFVEKARAAFSHLFGGRPFYKLAATAAAAVLVVATAQIALRESRVQNEVRLVSPLPSPAQAPTAAPAEQPPAAPPEAPQSAASAPESSSTPRGSSASPADSIPPAAPVKPQQQATRIMEPKPAGPAASPAPMRSRSQAYEEEAPPVLLTLRIPLDYASGKSDTASTMTEKAKAPPTGSGAAPTAKSMEGSGLDQETVKLEQPSQTGPVRRAISEVKRLVLLSNGKIISEPSTADSGKPISLLTEIPVENYPAFLDQLRRLFEMEFKGKAAGESAPRNKATVKVSVILDAGR